MMVWEGTMFAGAADAPTSREVAEARHGSNCRSTQHFTTKEAQWSQPLTGPQGTRRIGRWEHKRRNYLGGQLFCYPVAAAY
ncbi:hypothetical protein NXS19_012445 [Fusarium pseudograminearum]|nr:hypothetical protein NXS19_012445 [Fusarium pseudograminearum]